MNWLRLVPVALLLVQGMACLYRKTTSSPEFTTFVRWTGVLAVFLAGLGFILNMLLLTETLVPSVDLGIVMVQSEAARAALVGLIFGLSIAGALAWHVAGLGARRPSSALRLVAVGIAVGLLAALQVIRLNDPPLATLRVYSYDLLWPGLVLWLGLCFVGGSLDMLGVTDRLARASVTATLVAGLALWARLQPRDEEWGALVWPACLVVFLPLATALAATLPARAWGLALRTLWIVAGIFGAAALGLVSASMVSEGGARRVLPWLLLAWPLAVLVALRHSYVSLVAGAPSWRQTVAVVALAAVVCSLVDLFYFAVLGPLAGLFIFVLAWIVMTEVSVGGPVARLMDSVTQHRILSSCISWAHSAVDFAKRTMTEIITGFRSALSVSSFPVLLAKALIIVAVLVAAYEVFNAGKTLVYPFAGPKDAKERDTLGPLLSERLVNALGILDRELTPDFIRLLPATETYGPAFRLGGAGIGTIDAALTKSPELDVGFGLKIPASALVEPVRLPMRAVLGVHTITGGVQVVGDRYVALAAASSGEVWRTEVTAESAETAVAPLSEQLAFQIIVGTDRSVRMAGMTDSWTAFSRYREGMGQWRTYEATGDPEALAGSIRALRSAVQERPAFGLAHYRLGLALQRDGQPGAAADALRVALRTDRRLTAAYIALASTLYDLDAGDLPPVGPAPTPLRTTPRARSAVNEARTIWYDVLSDGGRPVSASDTAAAFYGLCRDAMPPVDAPDANAETAWRLAYYYCRRASEAFARLTPAQRTDAQIKSAEAAVMDALGETLQRRAPQAAKGKQTAWHCAGAETLPGRYTKAALFYYAHAETLMPYNAAIRCNAASAAASLNDWSRMKVLEWDAAARHALGQRYAWLAERNQGDFDAAFSEYQHALLRDPTWFPTLLAYPRALWLWRRRHIDARISTTLARQTEEHARTALRLAGERLGAAERAQARAAVGQALLAQARAHEAAVELVAALEAAPNVANQDEVRWDLAQAHICAADNDDDAGITRASAPSREKALPLLDQIRRNEETRERRPYTTAGLLDSSRHERGCRLVIVSPRPQGNGPLFALRDGKPEYMSHTACAWSGVSAVAYGLDFERVHDIVLHVWRPGVNEHRSLSSAGRPRIVLSSAPRATRWEYYARLEDEAGQAVSEVHAIETFPSPSKGGCPRNLVLLTFDRVR